MCVRMYTIGLLIESQASYSIMDCPVLIVAWYFYVVVVTSPWPLFSSSSSWL